MESNQDESFLGIMSMDEFLKMEKPPRVSVVEGKIHKGEFHTVIGPAKLGKSSFVQNLAKAIVLGEPFLGFPVITGKVLYCQTELDPTNFEERMKEMFGEHGVHGLQDRFHLSFKRFRMDNEEDMLKTTSQIKLLNPDLVIFDPFYTYHSKQEDSSSEMSRVLYRLKKAIEDIGCAGVLVHHAGKQGDGNIGQHSSHHGRGSSSFADVPDGIWTLRRTAQEGHFTLSGTFRNVKSFSSMHLKCNGVAWEALASEAPSETIGSVDDLVSLFAPGVPMTTAEILKGMADNFGISESTAEKRKGIALGLGRIKKDGRGVYSLPEPPPTAALEGGGSVEASGGAGGP